MKKLLLFSLFALIVVVAVVACSDSGGTTPVAPAVDDGSNLASVTAERRNSTPVLLCHNNSGDCDDGDPCWVVIEVDNGSHKFRGHLRHGDWDTSGGNDCVGLESLAVGSNCACCNNTGGGQCGTI